MDSSMESYKRQAMGSLQVVKLFLDELKGLGIYDDSIIFVMGDHGIFEETLNIQGAAPLLLIKKCNSHGIMEISDVPVSLSDIPATVFSELGFEGEFSGEDIFSLTESTNRTRTYYFYNWFSPGFADWSKEYLPPMKKYLISGPVYLEDSWHMTDDVFTYEPDEDLTIEWQAGFSVPQVGPEGPWVWGSSEGKMVLINNTTEERRCIFSGAFSTGYDEPANLSIKGDLMNENIVIDRYGYDFRKEILVTPGQHYIDFLCDAREFDLPDCPSSFVFKVEYFKISECTADGALSTSDLLQRWTDGFSFLEGNSGGNWRWCSSQGTLVLTNTSNQDREYRMSATFWTGYPDPANLVIESSLFADNLTINNAEYMYSKEFILPPGRHLVHLTCDAKMVDAPGDPRTMVFCVGHFQITEGD
jgi:predicted secreted protein